MLLIADDNSLACTDTFEEVAGLIFFRSTQLSRKEDKSNYEQNIYYENLVLLL